jgi:serine/threonine-protein kinase
MGEVYRADDLKLGQSVALKFLPDRLASNPMALDRFRREVRTAREVTHPNVCRIHDIGEIQGQPFLSMEFVDGEDLAHALRRLGRPTKEKALEIARHVCLGLAAAHESGVIHRDLKPANIMIDGRGRVRIMDFGIAGFQEEFDKDTRLAGTPAYLAPELLTGGKASVQSDIYAVGLLLYEIFTGRRAYEANDLRQLIDLTETATPTPPSTFAADLDPLVERAILSCLEKDPRKRPSSVYALLAMLPGGDPLAQAMASGKTPSPEMVAAAGEENVLDRRIAGVLLGSVVVGLALLCWLAGDAYLANQAGLNKHPEVLVNDARLMLKGWGYTNAPGDFASGFRQETPHECLFWYRQRPTGSPLGATLFYNDWGLISYARATLLNPQWGTRGELGLTLDAKGHLRWFRAIPRHSDARQENWEEPDWSRWFPTNVAGFELSRLEEVEQAVLLPRDPYDHLQWWKAQDKGEGGFYVGAAAIGGRPVYFQQLGAEGVESYLASASGASTELELGRRMLVFIYVALMVGAGVLAWHNFRTGRSDRRGAFRVAVFLFASGMITWAVLSHHIPEVADAGPLEVGLAHALFSAGVLWLWYTAAEPFVRKLWPQTLISWSRLLEGRWRDSRVGRDLLFGVVLGVAIALLYGLQVLIPSWLTLSPQPPIRSDVLTLEGPLATIGFMMMQLRQGLMVGLFVLLLLVFLRFLLRRNTLAAAAFVVIWTPVWLLMTESHPVIGWFIVGLSNVLYVIAGTRFGLLTIGVGSFTTSMLAGPITTDFSAWYAGYSVLALGVLGALAIYGFYTSQGGRPLFDNPLLGTPSDPS